MVESKEDWNKWRGLESLDKDKHNWTRKNIVIGRRQKEWWEEYIENSEFANFSDFVRTACKDYIKRNGKKTAFDIDKEVREHLAKYFKSLSEGIRRGKPQLCEQDQGKGE